MSTKRTLGGQRIGSGNKMTVEMHGYGRSTHNKSRKVMTTAAPGVIYPIWKELCMPLDTWDIDLELEILTKPTNGPLFDTYDVEVHIFESPLRLYNGDVHNNELNIGNDMSAIKLPTVTLFAAGKGGTKTYEPTEQVNPSSLLCYLGIPGIGRQQIVDNQTATIERTFNATPILAYYDIFKNYFANVQEDNAYVIHATPVSSTLISTVGVKNGSTTTPVPIAGGTAGTGTIFVGQTQLVITLTAGISASQIPQIMSMISIDTANEGGVTSTYLFAPSTQSGTGITTITTGPAIRTNTVAKSYTIQTNALEVTPQLTAFPLNRLDDIRQRIMRATGTGTAFNLNTSANVSPWNLLWQANSTGGIPDSYSMQFAQEGLMVGTYKSDVNNNWLKTATIDSVSQRTAVTIFSNKFSMDSLNIAEKMYKYLNRISVSGGTYKDWLEVTYDMNRIQECETPIYHGGLMKEIAFQEVVSTAATEEQPLGQLAGRGRMTGKHKGGKVTIHVKEPGYLMAMLKITPKITYSQGIDWDMNLTTFDDLHKPAFDGIGFQDLISETMDWRSTEIDATTKAVLKKAIGKQPAWINYQTAVNTSFGEFAAPTEMFMTLNRQYEQNTATGGIKDATSYVDPKKFNNIFADTKISAMNFWVQAGFRCTARRLQSANQIPTM